LSTATITVSQAKLKKLQPNSMHIRIYVREEPHYSGMTTTELAQKLTAGYVFEVTGDDGRKHVIDVPARPFFKQFIEENKEVIIGVIKESKVWLLTGSAADSRLDKLSKDLLDFFQSWILEGSVKPDNSSYTIKKKGSSNPMIDTGQLLSAITEESEVASVK
jgi:hypothetical protein